MLCVSTMIIKILNGLLSSQMVSPFPAKQRGCYTVGHLILVKFIYNFVLHACSLKHVSRLQPLDRTPRTQAGIGHLRDSNFICLQMHLSENCFDYYSFQSQINYI